MKPRGGGGGGGPSSPWFLAPVTVMLIGASLTTVGLLLGSSADASADERAAALAAAPTDSLTSLLDAAGNGTLASVVLDTPTGRATAKLTSGKESLVVLPAFSMPDIALRLANAGIPVSWSKESAVLPATTGVPMLQPGLAPAAQATPGAAAPNATEEEGTAGRAAILLYLGIATLIGGSLWLAFLYHQRRQAAAATASGVVNGSAVIPGTRFSDVAGVDEAVEDLRELVDYLKNPERFDRLGALPPRGALLTGPPGTGKTLLARAVAGEAGVPVFVASGSEFVEMYVGVGARRIRALFAKARKASPSIIFIDEIDAVARSRSSKTEGGGGAEVENTLIALLTELDGFASRDVIVIAATNREDVIDPALTRPGRLDRSISVPLPDRRGRERILEVHARTKPLNSNVDLPAIARRTPGFSGAQLKSVVNEAALVAVRRNANDIDSAAFDAAVATIAMGRARTSALVTEHDRRVTAWHEAGHAVAALLLADADNPVAVSIVPRGPAGGVTWMAGSDDQFLTRKRAHARLVVALGGRVGEQMLMEGEFTQGAYGDLRAATDQALAMITLYGMTGVGLAVRAEHLGGTGTKEVTQAVDRLLADAHREATSLLEAHRELMTAVADALLEHEDLDAHDLARIAALHKSVTVATPIPRIPTWEPLEVPSPVAAMPAGQPPLGAGATAVRQPDVRGVPRAAISALINRVFRRRRANS